MAKLVKKYIPEGSDPQIEKFICCLMKEGKKSIARRLFHDALDIIKTRTKDAPMEVFQKALLNVTPLVEVRPKRVAGAVYQCL
jgi:small subunit ribosomal protein S7